MAEKIPQGVVYRVEFRAFLASDGKSLAPGKTIAIQINKNGAAWGNPSGGALNATEVGSVNNGLGWYYFDLTTTDTNTIGPLGWIGTEGTILQAGDVLNVDDMTTRIYRASQAIVLGVVGVGSTITSVVTSSLSPPCTTSSGQWKGKILAFDKNTTTANLRGQSAVINGVTTGGVIDLTGSALTDNPASGDTFTIQ